MNKANIIQALKESTQYCVGEKRYSMELVYDKAADEILSMVAHTLKEVCDYSDEEIAGVLNINMPPRLPRAFADVVFTTHSGKIYRGSYHPKKDVFVTKGFFKKEIRVFVVKGWHYV